MSKCSNQESGMEIAGVSHVNSEGICIRAKYL